METYLKKLREFKQNNGTPAEYQEFILSSIDHITKMPREEKEKMIQEILEVANESEDRGILQICYQILAKCAESLPSTFDTKKFLRVLYSNDVSTEEKENHCHMKFTGNLKEKGPEMEDMDFETLAYAMLLIVKWREMIQFPIDIIKKMIVDDMGFVSDDLYEIIRILPELAADMMEQTEISYFHKQCLIFMNTRIEALPVHFVTNLQYPDKIVAMMAFQAVHMHKQRNSSFKIGNIPVVHVNHFINFVLPLISGYETISEEIFTYDFTSMKLFFKKFSYNLRPESFSNIKCIRPGFNRQEGAKSSESRQSYHSDTQKASANDGLTFNTDFDYFFYGFVCKQIHDCEEF